MAGVRIRTFSRVGYEEYTVTENSMARVLSKKSQKN